MPAPNVDSCVIRLDIKKETPQNVLDEKLFFRLVKAAFSQRRKTLVNPVSGSLGVGKPRLKQLMEESGIKSTARAEELTMEQFIQLANGITMLKK